MLVSVAVGEELSWQPPSVQHVLLPPPAGLSGETFVGLGPPRGGCAGGTVGQSELL